VTAFKRSSPKQSSRASRPASCSRPTCRIPRRLADLVEWSASRFTRSGGTIKVRLVKGANLAMETTEAELHGWSAAPYRSKADVDASYARLIDAALRPEHADAVRIGIASHNSFIWRGLSKWLDHGESNDKSTSKCSKGWRIPNRSPSRRQVNVFCCTRQLPARRLRVRRRLPRASSRREHVGRELSEGGLRHRYRRGAIRRTE